MTVKKQPTQRAAFFCIQGPSYVCISIQKEKSDMSCLKQFARNKREKELLTGSYCPARWLIP